MGVWRYYVQRAKSGVWLDTQAALAGVSLTWATSGPASGKANVPASMNKSPFGSDGQLTWGKFNTYLWAEEDGNLAWMGICIDAVPGDDGSINLEFIGPSGWLQRVPFLSTYSAWTPNAFDVIRMLFTHAATYTPRIDYVVSTNKSAYKLGDVQPPAKPKQPKRKKGQSATAWQGSAAYKKWQKDNEAWNTAHSSKKAYAVNWWDSAYVGGEMDRILKEVGSDYRERFAWADRGNLVPRIYIDLEDNLVNRRSDIQFIDGQNLVDPIDPKEGTDNYANRVIGLGAGEGRARKRVTVGQDDGRLYQAEYVEYANISNTTTLTNMSNVDHKILSNLAPSITKLKVRDVAGFATTGSLRCGDEVETISPNIVPPFQTWVRIMKITRDPTTSVVDLEVEQAAA